MPGFRVNTGPSVGRPLTAAFLVALLFLPTLALSASPRSTRLAPVSLDNMSLAGMGVYYGKAQDTSDIEVSLSYYNSEIILPPEFYFSQYQYSYSWFRVEGGTGFGISGQGAPLFNGQGLIPYENGVPGLGAHLGYELTNISYSANFNDERTEYIAWKPMLSIGVLGKPERGNYSFLWALKVGGIASTLNTVNPLEKAVGAILLLSTPNFIWAAEANRVADEQRPFDMLSSDLVFHIAEEYSFGFRLDGIFPHKSERGNPMGFGFNRTDWKNYEYRVTVGFRVAPNQSVTRKDVI